MERPRKQFMGSPHVWGTSPRSIVPQSLGCDQCRGTHFKRNDGHAPDLINNDDHGPIGGYSTMNRAHGGRLHSPISTEGWTFDSVLGHGKNFRAIERIKATSPIAVIEQAIGRYEEGIPMIIEGWHEHEKWPREMFTLDTFKKHSVDDTINVRNIHDLTDSTLSLEDFIEQCRKLPPCMADDEDVRMYGKDAECPAQWKDYLETTGMMPDSLLWDGPQDYFRYRPQKAPVETLMCYLGIGDTFTAAHKDLCASSGHNLMCYTENDGASYWFMTKGSDAPDVSEYFQKLGQELDHETHVISLNQLKKAPFDIYIGKQVLGDLVLVPPRSCHQVVNFGGITLKTSWSRMSLKGLSTALYHELPIYQRVCRFETYRVKSTIFYSLQKQVAEIEDFFKRLKSTTSTIRLDSEDESKTRRVLDEKSRSLSSLFAAYKDILNEEYAPNWKEMEQLEREDHLNGESVVKHIMCDFCGCDIFQSFWECLKCIPQGASVSGDREGYTICAPCYVEGRGCACLDMEPKQVYSFDLLLNVQREAVKILRLSGRDLLPFNPQPNHQSIFVAAYCLYEQRKRPGNICFIDKSRAQGLQCKQCHNSRCFLHLLVGCKLHASDGLLMHRSDRTHKQYHELHKTLRETYPNRVSQVKDCQRLGNAPEVSLAPYLRAHLALAHNVCRPVYFSLSSPGFYDFNTQDCDQEPVDEDNGLEQVETEMSTLTPCSTTTSLPVQRADVDMVDEDMPSAIIEPLVSRLTRNARARSEFLDFVAVPRMSRPMSPPQSKSRLLGEGKNDNALSTQIPKIGRPPSRKLNVTSTRSLASSSSKPAPRIPRKKSSITPSEASSSSATMLRDREGIYTTREGAPMEGLSSGNHKQKKADLNAALSNAVSPSRAGKRKWNEPDAFPSNLATAMNLATARSKAAKEQFERSLIKIRPQVNNNDNQKAATSISAPIWESKSMTVPSQPRKKRKSNPTWFTISPPSAESTHNTHQARSESLSDRSSESDGTGILLQLHRGRRKRQSAKVKDLQHSDEEWVEEPNSPSQQAGANDSAALSLSTSSTTEPTSPIRHELRINSGIVTMSIAEAEVSKQRDTRTSSSVSSKSLLSSGSTPSKKKLKSGLVITFEDNHGQEAVDMQTMSSHSRTLDSARMGESASSQDLAAAMNYAHSHNTSVNQTGGRHATLRNAGPSPLVEPNNPHAARNHDSSLPPITGPIGNNSPEDDSIRRPTAFSQLAAPAHPQAVSQMKPSDGSGSSTPVLSLHIHMPVQQGNQPSQPPPPPRNLHQGYNLSNGPDVRGMSYKPLPYPAGGDRRNMRPILRGNQHTGSYDRVRRDSELTSNLRQKWNQYENRSHRREPHSNDAHWRQRDSASRGRWADSDSFVPNGSPSSTYQYNHPRSRVLTNPPRPQFSNSTYANTKLGVERSQPSDRQRREYSKSTSTWVRREPRHTYHSQADPHSRYEGESFRERIRSPRSEPSHERGGGRDIDEAGSKQSYSSPHGSTQTSPRSIQHSRSRGETTGGRSDHWSSGRSTSGAATPLPDDGGQGTTKSSLVDRLQSPAYESARPNRNTSHRRPGIFSRGRRDINGTAERREPIFGALQRQDTAYTPAASYSEGRRWLTNSDPPPHPQVLPLQPPPPPSFTFPPPVPPLPPALPTKKHSSRQPSIESHWEDSYELQDEPESASRRGSIRSDFTRSQSSVIPPGSPVSEAGRLTPPSNVHRRDGQAEARHGIEHNPWTSL